MLRIYFHSKRPLSFIWPIYGWVVKNNDHWKLKNVIIAFQIENLNYELSVDHKVIDIDNYLPFKSVSEIIQFCSSEDGLLELKKAAFRRRIYAAGRRQGVAVFAPSIVDAFFEGSPLLGSHKWPYKK